MIKVSCRVGCVFSVPRRQASQPVYTLWDIWSCAPCTLTGTSTDAPASKTPFGTPERCEA
ncbi:hypothetical protein SM39_2126 [Serratia marcescens SM39]|uniref:Uncharacterized protein n=1 Tax=Serratia marcescens SM39 TaxID=1334564 RepID=A0AAT9EXK9_SERMA|nr:hypothetical protein SM39_2126 [Serratia marcescens SM39]